MGDFDPSKHLRKLRGRGGESDYLDVKWRIVWFRDRFPRGHIETNHIELSEVHAIFKATVTAIAEGGEIVGRATGYGSETQGDFQDFIEKAESRAIGRALAALGFGTQFAADEFGETTPDATVSGQQVVDSPIDFASTRGRPLNGGSQYDPYPNQGARPAGNTSQTVTPRQLKFMQVIAREAGKDEATVRAEVQEMFGCAVEELGRREASEYIERLQSLRNPTIAS